MGNVPRRPSSAGEALRSAICRRVKVGTGGRCLCGRETGRMEAELDSVISEIRGRSHRRLGKSCWLCGSGKDLSRLERMRGILTGVM